MVNGVDVGYDDLSHLPDLCARNDVSFSSFYNDELTDDVGNSEFWSRHQWCVKYHAKVNQRVKEIKDENALPADIRLSVLFTVPPAEGHLHVIIWPLSLPWSSTFTGNLVPNSSPSMAEQITAEKLEKRQMESLPTDIVHEIFKHLAIPIPVNLPRLFPWCLGQVCTTWRKAFVSAPW